MRPSLILVAALLSGCSLLRPDLSEVLAEFVEENPNSYLDCGDMDVPFECDWTAPQANHGCLIDAYASCLPATISLRDVLAEGEEINTQWYVHGSGPDDCTVTMFVDTTLDPEADVRRIIQYECAVPTTGIDACEPLVSSGCVEVDRW